MAGETCKCPKCDRTLTATGELTVAGVVLPVFQCDECIREVDVFGELMELSFTFCLDEDGNWFDPAESDGPEFDPSVN